jgi:hypothetical protein
MKRLSYRLRIPLSLLALFSSCDLNAESVSQNSDATTLVNSLAGNGVTVSGETLTATDSRQSGTFSGFNFLTNNEMDEGVLLSSGNIASLVNGSPSSNTLDYTTTVFNAYSVNDSDLGDSIFDPVKLSFNVTPQYDTLIIDFMFGSEEYTEYVDQGYNDKMRILVDGTDCALTPDGQQFSIDSVNNNVNAALFNNNDLNDGGASFATEMDGFTGLMSCRVSVTPGDSIPVVIGLSEEGDANFDSWAFFRAQSLRSEASSDYGDAPDTYGTLQASGGARHKVVEGVYIGSKPTGDGDGFVEGVDDSAGTAGDDSDDGVGSFPLLTDVTTSYSLTVNATSINGNDSKLVGWIDFDGDGAFQSDEASNIATVSSGTFESDVVLTWNNIGGSGPDIALGDTFVRLRITNSGITAADSGGYFDTGEVEDYSISVTDGVAPVVAITSAPTATALNAGSYTVSGTCTVGDGDVTVSIAGATPASQTASCSGSGAWSAIFDVSAIGDGASVIAVNASQTDAAANIGNASQVEADKDIVSPAIVILNAPAAVSNLTPYNVTFEFNDDVTGFVAGDIQVGNGSLSNFTALDGNTYTADITPDGSGDITLDVAANVAQDSLSNQNLAAEQVTTVLSGDSDGDGIPDLIECPSGPPYDAATCGGDDTDGDSTPDYQDLDSDQDGIPDSVEAGGDPEDPADTDNDGTADFRDRDADGDGIPDSLEAGDDPNNPLNTDGDANPDYLDLDADADGVTDAAESGASGNDTDGDGIDDAYDVDQTGGSDFNGDGVDDAVAPLDSNGDGTSDYQDNTDTDADGLVDSLDMDDDNDGILDSSEGNEAVDTDGDGVADSLDLDSDNDGLFDLNESGGAVAGLDGNSDGRIDSSVAHGGNGYADLFETDVDSGSANYSLIDSDGDGVRNFRDLDSDGDGLYDLLEGGGSDDDSNGRVDGLNDSDGDGLHDALSGSGLPVPDSDADGVIDALDLDSDNDGIYDVTEAGGGDSDGDGLLGKSPQSVDADGVADGSGLSRLDSDSDGVVDRLDLDSDNDGIPDVTDAGGSDPDGDGLVGSGSPSVDVNGVTDSPILPGDVDSDDTPNHLDSDADGDGLLDIVEGGGFDADGNGMVDGLSDGNGDGLDDLIAGSPLPLPDSDGDGIADFLDNDDLDNDGVPDSADVDIDNDGIPNDLEGDGSVDTDGDGVPDTLDLDSDNDGIYDLDESGADAAALDADEDGRIDTDKTVSGNGLADVVETAIDSGAISYNSGVLRDTDSDGVADFRDLDSDNDGLYDVTETGGSDPDADGVLGTGTPTVNGAGMAPGAGQPAPDNDGDGVADPRDVDSDNDSVPDVVEDGGSDPDDDGRVGSAAPSVDPATGVPLVGGGLIALDSDSDGTPNHLDIDSDGDALFDLEESARGATDTQPKDGVIDVISDNDGNGWDDDQEGLAKALPDSDRDGLPDIWDKASGSSQSLQTGLNGVGGCAMGSGTVFDPVLPLLVLLSLTYVGWRHRLNST